MMGYRNPSIYPFFTPLGSGSILRLFLAIRPLVFSAEWLFYHPLRLFSPFFACKLSLREGLRCTPHSPSTPFSHAPFPSLFPLFPGGTAIQLLCTDDLALSPAQPQMNPLPSTSQEMTANSFLSLQWHMAIYVPLTYTDACHRADDKGRDMTYNKCG